ncbi:hypothetical protein F4813DRAFT_390857 [Daldinia decipiens]|uniref:uncharacterized protein n=1 Tax=Daldinia decipiens TaxID=326647 RepID=UPI0020C255C4|nr:uncharacterized protein F4813DRAFT_390857 [Daldinia decipiens]KAI1656176.1 hypothetical protein F4813DRAFT_390857 [Daldinia decipiens]
MAFGYVNWTLIALVAPWTLVFLFFDIFACRTRLAASWERWDSLRQHYVDTFGMRTGCAVFSWALDLAMLIEPLVMTLNMSRRRKVQESLVFLCSAL